MQMYVQELHDQITAVDELYGHYASIKGQHNLLQRKYGGCLRSLKTLKEECKNLKAANITTSEHDAVVKERDQLKIDYLNKQNEFDEFVNSTGVRYQSSCKELEKLKAEYTNLKQTYSNLESVNKTLKECKLCKKKDKLIKESADLKKENRILKQTVNDYDEFKTKYKDLSLRNTEITSENQRLKHKAQSLELRIQQLEREKLTESNKVTRIDEELGQLFTKYASLEDRCKEITNQRDEFRNQVEISNGELQQIKRLRICDVQNNTVESDEKFNSLLLVLRNVVDEYETARNKATAVAKLNISPMYNVNNQVIMHKYKPSELISNSKTSENLLEEPTDDVIHEIFEWAKCSNLLSPVPSPPIDEESALHDIDTTDMAEIDKLIERDLLLGDDDTAWSNLSIFEAKSLNYFKKTTSSISLTHDSHTDVTIGNNGDHQLKNVIAEKNSNAEGNLDKIEPDNIEKLTISNEVSSELEIVSGYIINCVNQEELTEDIVNEQEKEEKLNLIKTDPNSNKNDCVSLNVDETNLIEEKAVTEQMVTNQEEACSHAQLNPNKTESDDSITKIIHSNTNVEMSGGNKSLSVDEISSSNVTQKIVTNREEACSRAQLNLDNTEKITHLNTNEEIGGDKSLCLEELPGDTSLIDESEHTEKITHEQDEQSSNRQIPQEKIELIDIEKPTKSNEIHIRDKMDENDVIREIENASERTFDLKDAKSSFEDLSNLKFNNKLTIVLPKNSFESESIDSAFFSNSSRSTEYDWLNSPPLRQSSPLVTHDIFGDMSDLNTDSEVEKRPAKLRRTHKKQKATKKKNINNELTLGFQNDNIVVAVTNFKNKYNVSPRSNLMKTILNVRKTTKAGVTKTPTPKTSGVYITKKKKEIEKTIIEETPCVCCRIYNLRKRPVTTDILKTHMGGILNRALGNGDEPSGQEQISPKKRRIAHTPKTLENVTGESNCNGSSTNTQQLNCVKPSNSNNKINIISIYNIVDDVVRKETDSSSTCQVDISPTSPEPTVEVNELVSPVIIPTETIGKPTIEVNDLVSPVIIPTKTIGTMSTERGRKLLATMLQFCNNNYRIFTIAKKFVQQSPDFIVPLILERVAVDIHDVPTKGKYPTEPCMTVVQRGLYKFIMALEKLGVQGVGKRYCEKADLYLRTVMDPILIPPVTLLYIAICKGKSNYWQMRMAVCSALADLGDLAIPFIYLVLQMWVEVIPRKGIPAHDHVLTRALIQIILMKNVQKPGYNFINLRSLLFNYYGFSSDGEDTRVVFKELVKCYTDEGNECARVLAIALSEYVTIKLITDEIIANLQSEIRIISNVDRACAAITFVTHITKHMATRICPKIVESNVAWLKQFCKECYPHAIRERADELLKWFKKCQSAPYNILQAT